MNKDNSRRKTAWLRHVQESYNYSKAALGRHKLSDLLHYCLQQCEENRSESTCGLCPLHNEILNLSPMAEPHNRKWLAEKKRGGKG